MMVRRARTLAAAVCAAAIAACDSPTDPASPAIKGLDSDAPLVAATTCVTGASSLVVSVYPKTIAVGAHATPFASVYSSTGAALSSRTVKWTIQDTTIVHVTGIDSNGRPILTGRRAGTTGSARCPPWALLPPESRPAGRLPANLFHYRKDRTLNQGSG